MKRFRHNVVRWLRRLLAPADGLRADAMPARRAPPRFVAEPREFERALAAHGIDGHEWEEFEDDDSEFEE
jgi:hypothetical protein